MFCPLFQFMISGAADAGQPLGPVTRRHVLRCADCRRFLRSCRTLGEDLRSEAATLSPASRHLTGRILAGLPRAERRRSPRAAWTALATAACISVAAWIAFLGRGIEPASTPAPPVYAISAPHIELATTWARVFEAPLLAEAQNLSNNAQSGIRFLVACLDVSVPEGIASPQTGESSPPPVQ